MLLIFMDLSATFFLDVKEEMYIYAFLPLIINHIARNKIRRVTNE